jgi:ribosomal protein S18 acetylase RimI-like enzyme
MSAIPDQLSDNSAIEEIEQGLVDGYKAWNAWDEIEVHESPEMTWTISDVPYPMFNAVLRTRLAPKEADSMIDDVMAQALRGLIPMAWYVLPSSQPSDLEKRLEARGFTLMSRATGMTADLQHLKLDVPGPGGLTIEAVKNEEELKDWCSVMAQAFDMPDFATDAMLRSYRAVGFGQDKPCLHYLARLEGLPVGTSSLFLGGSAATLANVASLADFRRQGIGSAVTFAPLTEARMRGYSLGTLAAYDIGKGVYQRLGFVERCKLGIYMWMRE